MKTIASILFIIIFSIGNLTAQSELKPTNIQWKADSKEISLKDAYDIGIDKPDELGLVVYFDSELLKKYKKEDFTLEFRWFHYYSTTKEFMNKQTISYDKIETSDKTKFSVSSKRENLRSGWWEVIVTAKYDDKQIAIDGIKRFQVYIK